MMNSNQTNINKKLEIALQNCFASKKQIEKKINSLSSASLKKILKAISQVNSVTALEGNAPIKLNEEEQLVVEMCFKLTENVLGYSTLLHQQEQKNNPTTEKGENDEFKRMD